MGMDVGKSRGAVGEKLGVDVGKFIMEKLNEFLLILEKFWALLVKKSDEVFPPETREEKIKHWLEVGWPVGLAAGLLLLCVCCCCSSLVKSCCICCGSSLRSCYRCFCCCCRSTRRKMMKAPGRRPSYMMPRDDFEDDPRSYFIDLRSSNSSGRY